MKKLVDSELLEQAVVQLLRYGAHYPDEVRDSDGVVLQLRAALSAPQQDAVSIATLHDDGYWTANLRHPWGNLLNNPAQYRKHIKMPMEVFIHPAPSVPEGWQPIETAPRDGTEILLANSEVAGGFMVVASFDSAYSNPWIKMMMEDSKVELTRFGRARYLLTLSTK